MGTLEFVIAIVAITVVGGIIRDRQRMKAGYAPRYGRKSRRKHRHGNGNGKGMDMDCPLCAGLAANGESPEEFEARLAKLAALEGRVQVLEKIVTDKGRTLADEIDGL